MATKRKLSTAAEPVAEELTDPSDELMFLNLGGGNEVGRSCHILQYKGKTVMLDAGMHPAYEGLAALPYYDEFDLSAVDVLLVSHFHIDHAASLPYVLAKTNFRGRVFMTHPTKAIYKWLIQDSVRVSGTSSSADQKTDLFTEADHWATFPRIEPVDYYTTHTVSSIRFTPYPAGHVLGAAMFLIEIAGLRIFFTGDYSREINRHLVSAEVPKNVQIDVLITESTYGIASHVPRLERETALMKSITGILNREGRVLMPVFALGMAQELLLLLEDYWARHPEFQRIPIYYASNLARKCMEVYGRYIGAMNDNIKRIFREKMAQAERSGDAGAARGPWDFEYIRSLRNLERFDDGGQCVVLASPGMMQNGVSRELLERWAPDPRNGVVITGYSVEGTMAKEILNEPEQIPAIMSNRNAGGMTRQGRTAGDEKPMIPRRCTVQEFSFAAHVDGVENREFIEEAAAPVVILVHGEKHAMMRLKSRLLSLNAHKAVPVKVYTPENTREVRIPFQRDKTAKVVGRLAQLPRPTRAADARLVSGVLVQNDFKLSLMAPEDLKEYAGLTTTTLTCKQRLTLGAAGVGLIQWALEGTFGSVEVLPGSPQANGHATNGNGHGSGDTQPADEELLAAERDWACLVMGCVTVRVARRGEVTVEWEGNVLNDGIADAVLAVLYTVETSPAAVKQSAQTHSHDPPKNPHADISPKDRFERLCMLLEAQFGPDITPIETPPLHTGTTLPSHPKPQSEDDAESKAKSEAKPAIKPEPASRSASPSAAVDNGAASPSSSVSGDDAASTDKAHATAIATELARLHAAGVYVPGVAIRVDRYVATVWLETLAVECASAVFRDRVRAVVERAAETVAPLWEAAGGAGRGKG